MLENQVTYSRRAASFHTYATYYLYMVAQTTSAPADHKLAGAKAMVMTSKFHGQFKLFLPACFVLLSTPFQCFPFNYVHGWIIRYRQFMIPWLQDYVYIVNFTMYHIPYGRKHL